MSECAQRVCGWLESSTWLIYLYSVCIGIQMQYTYKGMHGCIGITAARYQSMCGCIPC